MKPYYQDNHIEIYNKDCRSMEELADNSVQCVVCSPPYWGLRKYSGEQELIWGPADCNHQWQPDTTNHDNLRFRGKNSIVGNERNRDIHPVDSWKDCEHQWGLCDTREMNYVQGNPEFARPHREHKNFLSITNTCSLCGAWKGAYGLEPTPEMYIEHTIEILREIHRVLRKDGVVFWNIGDSYMSHAVSQKWADGYDTQKFADSVLRSEGRKSNFQAATVPKRSKEYNLKNKDLCLIPFRVAIAAQEDGWWVRSIIIWSKPNPIPESVTDRPIESHEYILMLTKSKNYYWDADAVREKNTDPLRTNFVSGARTHGKNEDRNDNDLGERSKDFVANGRNIRSVWEFPTQPYPEAHFAVFPEKLPEICIKASTPEVGCCSKCGAPWERITDTSYQRPITRQSNPEIDRSRYDGQDKLNVGYRPQKVLTKVNKTLGWQPTCKCNADKVPSLVLDPFMGAGTVAWVAKKLGRKAVGYELSEEYCKLAIDRCRQQALGL